MPGGGRRIQVEGVLRVLAWGGHCLMTFLSSSTSFTPQFNTKLQRCMKALELLQLLTVMVPAGFLTPTLAIQMALAICSFFF